MQILVWLFRALVFFALFAFALNNQHEAYVRWFFGYGWRAPMIFVVLAAFAAGLTFGVLAMLPSWWRHRRRAAKPDPRSVLPEPAPVEAAATLPAPEHPPRDGL